VEGDIDGTRNLCKGLLGEPLSPEALNEAADHGQEQDQANYTDQQKGVKEYPMRKIKGTGGKKRQLKEKEIERQKL